MSGWCDRPVPLAPESISTVPTIGYPSTGWRADIQYSESRGLGGSNVECTVDVNPDSYDVNRLSHDHTLRRIRAGWPLASFEGFASMDGPGVLVTSRGPVPMAQGAWSFSRLVEAPAWCQPGPLDEPIGYLRGKTYLPTRPLAFGFAVNTALFAAPVLLVLSVPNMARRRRGWMGRCRACGYDRRGLGAGAVCPECGRGEAARVA